MRMLSHGMEIQPLPFVTKALLLLNSIFFVLELILLPAAGINLVSDYCLNPSRVINEFQTSSFTVDGMLSLFLSNLFHLNPLQSGPMGVLHILMNMMTLLSVGRYIETQFGSLPFLGITILFILFIGPLQIPLAMGLEAVTQNSISLLSTHQCGVGFSGVLFGYFMVYLAVIPSETIPMCGHQVQKWMVPLFQLLLLSVLLRASFIGHLSGIVMGSLYVTGIPGCFMQRQAMIKKMEALTCLGCISKRNDYQSAPLVPRIAMFRPSSQCCVRKNGVRENVEDSSESDGAETEQFL